MIGFNFSPYTGSIQKDIILKDGLRASKFAPSYSNITGVASSSGIYQVCFGLCFIFIRFNSDGNLAIPTNARIELPITPFSASKGTEIEYAADNFWLDARSGAVNNVRCNMSDITGLVGPQVAIPATASDYVLSGWYLIN